MRNYIILNGKNSNQINGLLIQELPPISKPLLRNQIEEIDGRDGDIVTPLGYSAYDKEFTIGLYKDFDVNEVAAYFNSEGTVIFSNEPDKYYYYQITAQIDFERLVRYRTATVTMHCQPFKYSATEQPITEDASGTVSDEGTNIALENTAEAPFNTLDLKGNTEQDTLSGKNLAKLKYGTYSYSAAGQTWNIADGVIRATRTDVTHQGGAINIATGAVAQWDSGAISDDHLTGSGGTYTLTFSRAGNVAPSSTSTARVCIYGFIYDDGGSTSGNGQMLVDLSSQSSGTYTLNLAADKHLGALVFYSQYISYSDVEFKVQLEQGTATDFEPYCGGIQSPNPDYPQPIQTVTGSQTVEIVGNNLFDGVFELGSISTTTGVDINDDNMIRSKNYAVIEGGENYTISVVGGGNVALRFYQSNGTFIGTGTMGPSPNTFTAPVNAGRVRFIVTRNTNLSTKAQCEKGSSATTWSPYSKQTYEINLGKNLFNKNDVEIGTVLLNGSFSDTYTDARTSGYVPVLPNTKYVTRGRPNGWAIQAFYTKDKTFIQRTATKSFTTPDNCYFARLECHRLDLDTFQCELGSTATTYAPYFEPIELCKLGDYQDYIWKDGEDWKVHKAIKKSVFDQNSGWAKNPLGTNAYNAKAADIFTAVAEIGVISPQFIAKSYNDRAVATNNIIYADSNNGMSAIDRGITIRNTAWSDLTSFITWVTSNPVIAYYVLATPTDTIITDQTLIEQLDDIYYHAHAYKGRTHIRSSAATGNMPLVIAAEVVEDNESTITNAGNYLSKPKITVYGSGDISLYINDMHVLQITLGDEGYITIDTAQMEAYKDTIDNLKNRLVIGDYSNARLKPGANKIHFTGKVTKYVVENYSRWL